MVRFKKVSHQYQDYELNICDVCDLPFNDYNDTGICDNCLEKLTIDKRLKPLRIKLGWLALYRAIINQEDSARARRRILEIGTQKTRYKRKRKQFLAA